MYCLFKKTLKGVSREKVVDLSHFTQIMCSFGCRKMTVDRSLAAKCGQMCNNTDHAIHNQRRCRNGKRQFPPMRLVLSAAVVTVTLECHRESDYIEWMVSVVLRRFLSTTRPLAPAAGVEF